MGDITECPACSEISLRVVLTRFEHEGDRTVAWDEKRCPCGHYEQSPRPLTKQEYEHD